METTGPTSTDDGNLRPPPATSHPPFVAPPPAALATAPLKPGDLVGSWRMLFIAGWVGVMAAFGAVAQAGRLAGLSPWWIGPQTNPRSIFVFVAPFILPVAAVVTALRVPRFACFVGIAAGLASAAVALGDTDYPGMALVELIIGVAGLFVSLACLAGRAVRPPEPPALDPPR